MIFPTRIRGVRFLVLIEEEQPIFAPQLLGDDQQPLKYAKQLLTKPVLNQLKDEYMDMRLAESYCL
jgi:hypothetical protein